MKNILKKSYQIIGLIISINATAQNNCEPIKKELAALKTTNVTLSDENRFLKQKLDFFTELNKPKDERVTFTNDKIDFKIVSVKGNRVSQRVVINYIVTNSTYNIELEFGCYDPKYCNAYDNTGNQLVITKIGLGNSVNNSLAYGITPTDTPLKGFFEIGNVLPGTDIIKSFSIPTSYSPQSGGSKTSTSLTFNDLKIQW